ncbi:MAG: SDR family oxidoreductase [Sulfuricaulis sp.]|nr:SDR family oxidoreductase [Sulfuricaulis sp.]
MTGAARGIGRSIAERLAAEGARVACLDIRADLLEPAVGEMRKGGLDAHAYLVDVGKRDEVHAAMQRIEADLGDPVSILVNNALWVRYQAIEDIDEATLDRIFAVGLKGYIWPTQAAAVQMKRHGSGAVINISSQAALVAFEKAIGYCSLKAAVGGFTRAAAMDLGPHGIRVNAIAPGMIETPASLGKFDQASLLARARVIPSRRMGQPSEIASVVAFLASDEASYINGAMLTADGGATIAGT